MSSIAGSTSRDLALGGTLPSASYVAAAAAARSSAKPSSSSSSSSSSSTSSSTSAYSSIVTIIRRSTGMSSRQAERAVGYSAITGTSLVALRVLLYAFRLVQGSTNNSIVDDEISDCTTDDVVITKTKRARTTSNSILSIFRRTLRRILLDDEPPTAISKDTTIDQEEMTDGPLITHQGSCHCESIQFTVLAPRCLAAHDGPGKIQFQHTEVRTSNFRVYAGHECLKTYYVVYRDSGKKGAHAFCERCGVHVLYAPSKQGKNLFINVRCLDDDGDRKVKIKSKKSSISDGIPAAGQFDHINSDQLSTISEVTQPFHFQMNNAYNNHLNTIQYPTNNKHDRHNFRRLSSDTSSIESSTGPSVEGAIEVPIKQFYATTNTTNTTTTTPIRKSRRSLPVYSNTKQQRPTTPTTSTATTASLTTIEADFDSSSSLYKGQLSELEMMVPTSPPREGGASLGGIDDFSFSGETISLMDDTSVMSGHISIASRRRKPSLRVSTGSLPGNHPPRHPTVTSPETRNKMKYFMAKYNKSQENNQNVELN
jgi:hypothetical protein